MSYDVVAVNLKTHKIRIMERDKTEKNAEAIVNFAVARRGVVEEFYARTAANSYRDGDNWDGER